MPQFVLMMMSRHDTTVATTMAIGESQKLVFPMHYIFLKWPETSDDDNAQVTCEK